MELVVLGVGAAYPGPGQASSGYLIKERDTSLLLDCGNGIVPRLEEAGELGTLTALLFSHLHADHLLDIFPLFYSRIYAKGRSYPSLPVYLPPGESSTFARLAEVLRVEPRRMFEGAFQTTEYDPSTALTVGDLRLTFLRNVHPVPTFAVRVESDEASVVYTADTAPHPDLTDLARGADLLLAEATLSGADYDPSHAIHLTPTLAAELAAKAGAGRLLLTHIWPHYDRQAMLDEARQLFPATDLAEELSRYPL